jgi:hypothetical protein
VENITNTKQEIQTGVKSIARNFANIGKNQEQIQAEENDALRAKPSEDSAKKISEQNLSNQVPTKRKKKLREVNFEKSEPEISQVPTTKKNDLTDNMPVAGKLFRANRQEPSLSEISGGVARASNPIDIKTYLQPEDWENGEMFVFDQASPAYASLEISEDVFKTVHGLNNRSLDTARSSKTERKDKERIILVADHIESRDIDDQLTRIVNFYSRACEEATKTGVKELVVMPCYPDDLNESERNLAERKMLKMLFASLSLVSEMRITLIARSMEEERTLEVSMKDAAKDF